MMDRFMRKMGVRRFSVDWWTASRASGAWRTLLTRPLQGRLPQPEIDTRFGIRVDSANMPNVAGCCIFSAEGACAGAGIAPRGSLESEVGRGRRRCGTRSHRTHLFRRETGREVRRAYERCFPSPNNTARSGYWWKLVHREA